MQLGPCRGVPVEVENNCIIGGKPLPRDSRRATRGASQVQMPGRVSEAAVSGGRGRRQAVAASGEVKQHDLRRGK